jgi:hypothetical protein
MPRTSNTLLPALLVSLSFAVTAQAASPPTSDYCPDPHSVQRYGPAYRYPQAGWIVLHIEGNPYERGYQHGRLLAPEIAACLRGYAAVQSPKAPTEGWRKTRVLVNALFLRRYEREYLEEMRGIADGATAAGARFDDRPIDLVDIVSLNAWPEIDFLDPALEATPTGLEGKRFVHRQPRAMPAPTPMHCSAFAATGPATKDGKVVIGHITMWSLYPANFFNVWLDLKPAKGHRVLMQTCPGGIQSGLDYYLNDAGLIVCETTLAQTLFDINGMSEASRIRQALQYASSIDDAVNILKTANNGLYTNEWLLADIKTNEIAMFELGTAKSKLYRSGKNEWFGGTEGFYWGCNNTKDLEVRLETIPGVHGRPANMVFCPSDRDKTWLRLYDKHKGKIDADFGKEAFTTPPLAAYHSVDAKFTTTELAQNLKTWALFGPPLGRTWQPTVEERQRFPEIRPLVNNPWTILHTIPPSKEAGTGPVAKDIPEPLHGPVQMALAREEDRPLPTVPAWHGTLLPKTDADIWLATAFSDYEKIVARANARHEGHASQGNGKVVHSSDDRDRLAVDLYAYRSRYLASVRAWNDRELAKTRSELTRSHWYDIASGKGVWVLHELRRVLGPTVFEELMDSFGREHAGQPVTAAEFEAAVEKTGKPRANFFDFWLRASGLPNLRLEDVSVNPNGKGYKITGTIVRDFVGPSATKLILDDNQMPPTVIDVFVETTEGETKTTLEAKSVRTPFMLETAHRPQRLLVDKYGTSAKWNGGVYSVLSFHGELEQTLIVYGTADEGPTNREAAEALQRAIIERHSNYTVPIKADKEVTENDLKSHHLLLIGRPDSNPLVRRFRDALPIAFGSRSFTVRGETYAHPGSAVIAAAENPLNPRFALVVLAGLGTDSTLHAPPVLLTRGQSGAEVLVLPNKGKPRALVVPARDLARELGTGDNASGPPK